MQKLTPAVAVFLFASALAGRQEPVTCGTHLNRTDEEIHLHRQAQQLRGKRPRAAAATAALPDMGNIAVLEDTDGVVARRNPFNLNARTVRFRPVAATAIRYRYKLDADSYDTGAASAGVPVQKLADDDAREFPLPFPFPFFGTQYRSVWVSSDGALFFAEPKLGDRTVGRLAAGPAAIAPLFRDLDPSKSVPGVRVLTESSRLVVSWVAVPEYADVGTGVLQTFQVRLYSDGRIEFAYSDVHTTDAVVGIGPGTLMGPTTLVSFLNNPSGEYTSTVAERFSGTDGIDLFAAAQKFYASHEDAYDYLVFYNNLGIEADSGVVAYEVTVRNKNRSGYGDTPVDLGPDSGSRSRLQAVLNMGSLSQYPLDTNAKVPARLTIGDTPLSVLAHEAGHLFLALVSVRDENGGEPMFGYDHAHWAFTFNSEASLLEGNRIEDRGTATSPRFLTTATVEGYSPLDQYLMGFRPPQDVPETFYVANPRGVRSTAFPRVGVGFEGERRSVRVEDIIQVAGRRTPDSTVSQRRFRYAFVLITAAGQPPAAEQLQQLEAYRSGLEGFFEKASSGNGSAETTLKRALHLSLFPAAGVLLGANATGTVSVDKAASTPLTVLLSPRSGFIGTPRSVIIPPGSTEASFSLAGLRAGVDELVASASDSTFETVTARLQVATPEQVTLSVVSGDQQVARAVIVLAQPVRVRLTDANQLPYPGVTLQAAAVGGGTLQNSASITDSDGTASFVWTPGSGLTNQLRISAPGGAAVVATAVGRPAFAARSVVNAASFAPGLAPGEIGTIFGANLANATVLLDGTPTQVFFANSGQINFFVPPETLGASTQVSVQTASGISDVAAVPVARTSPGIFFDGSSGFGAITVAGTGQVTPARPVRAGEALEIYATGLGATRDTNGLSVTEQPVQVSVGGAAAEVLFSGLTPGYAGLYQVNVRVPASAPSGTQTVSLSIGGNTSNEVKVQLQ